MTGGKSNVKFVLQEQHIHSLNAVMFCFLCWTWNKFPVSLKVSDECVLTASIIWELSWPSLHLYYRRRRSFQNTVF